MGADGPDWAANSITWDCLCIHLAILKTGFGSFCKKLLISAIACRVDSKFLFHHP